MEKNRMRFLEEMIQEAAKVYFGIQERKVHEGKRKYIE